MGVRRVAVRGKGGGVAHRDGRGPRQPSERSKVTGDVAACRGQMPSQASLVSQQHRPPATCGASSTGQQHRPPAGLHLPPCICTCGEVASKQAPQAVLPSQATRPASQPATRQPSEPPASSPRCTCGGRPQTCWAAGPAGGGPHPLPIGSLSSTPRWAASRWPAAAGTGDIIG